MKTPDGELVSADQYAAVHEVAHGVTAWHFGCRRVHLELLRVAGKGRARCIREPREDPFEEAVVSWAGLVGTADCGFGFCIHADAGADAPDAEDAAKQIAPDSEVERKKVHRRAIGAAQRILRMRKYRDAREALVRLLVRDGIVNAEAFRKTMERTTE